MSTDSTGSPQPVAAARGSLFPGRRAALIVAGMFLGLAIFYRGSYQLPISVLGLTVFGGLALLRPDLGLLFVPLTAPLYFMPKGIWDERFGIRPEGIRVPLHEVVLLLVLAATALSWLWHRATEPRTKNREPLWLRGSRFPSAALRAGSVLGSLPVALFLLAGTLGVLIAPPEGRGAALREWRWLIVEPLLFYGLVVYWRGGQGARPGQEQGLAGEEDRARALVYAFLLGGALVGLVGILQLAGLNLAPLIGDKVGFSDDQIAVEGVLRVTSVYGHPNNLGLYMGRVWPIAAALALAALQKSGAQGEQEGTSPLTSPHPSTIREQGTENREQRTDAVPLFSVPLLFVPLFFVLCSLFSFAGLLVSVSRGAWLGAAAAALALALLLGGQNGRRRWRLAGFAAGLIVIAMVGGAAALALGVERLNLLGESSFVRLKTWASAAAMWRDYPLLGVGLDQFGRLYPQYIDPALRETNEINTAHPHNLLLDIGLRMGIPGLLAFGWLIVDFYRRTSGRPAGAPVSPLRAGMIATMTAALVHGLVDSFYFWPDLAFAFWLLMAMAPAYPQTVSSFRNGTPMNTD